MANSEEARVIVGAIINLGRSLHLELVAEGIETGELLQRLITMGCQTGQGYLFSRPMPASEVAEWIGKHPPNQVAAAWTEIKFEPAVAHPIVLTTTSAGVAFQKCSRRQKIAKSNEKWSGRWESSPRGRLFKAYKTRRFVPF